MSEHGPTTPLEAVMQGCIALDIPFKSTLSRALLRAIPKGFAQVSPREAFFISIKNVTQHPSEYLGDGWIETFTSTRDANGAVITTIRSQNDDPNLSFWGIHYHETLWQLPDGTTHAVREVTKFNLRNPSVTMRIGQNPPNGQLLEDRIHNITYTQNNPIRGTTLIIRKRASR